MKRINLINNLFQTGVKDRDGLVSILKDAAQKNIIDNDALPIIEATLQMNRLKARDIMIPRHQIDSLDINDNMESLVDKIVKTGHSRFPVIDKEISNIIGVFHTKDLIRYISEPKEFDLRAHLRQVYFVPEIKHLDGLLYEMRVRQIHLAIVVDEFTNVVGMVSLEMVVEQLIGDIEDEYDSVEGEREVIELEQDLYRVKGYCKLSELNQMLQLSWHDEVVETIGGFLIKMLGRIPVVGESLNFEDVTIEIINSDSRKINLLTIRRLNANAI